MKNNIMIKDFVKAGKAAVEMDQSCTARGLVNCDILARSRAALENNKGII